MAYNLTNTAAQVNSALVQSICQNSGNYVGPTGNNAGNDAAFCIQTRNKQTALYIANGYTSFLHSNVLGFNSVNADASMCLYANKGLVVTDNAATYFFACNGQLRFGTLADKTALVINNRKLGLGTESPYYQLDMICYSLQDNGSYIFRMHNTNTGITNQGTIIQLATLTSGDVSTYYYYNQEIRAGQSNPVYPYVYRGGNMKEVYDDAGRHTFRGCNGRIKLLLHDNGAPGTIADSYFVSCNNANFFNGSGDWVTFVMRNDKKALGSIEQAFQNPSGYIYNSIQHRQYNAQSNPDFNGSSEMWFHTTPPGGSTTTDFFATDRRKLVLQLAWNQCAYFHSGVNIADALCVQKTVDMGGLAVLRSNRTRFGADNGNYGYHWFASRDYTVGDPGSLGYGFNQTAGGYITEHQWMLSGKQGMYLNSQANLYLNNCGTSYTGSWHGITAIQTNKENGHSLGQFLDFANENGTVHSSVHSQNWADGSSELRFLVTPAGARNADRRVWAAKIFPDKTFCSYGTILADGGIGAGDASFNTTTSRGARATHVQGAYLEWNKDSGGGKTYLLNQKGAGGGGFVIGEVSTANVISERLTIDGNGHALHCTNAGGVDNAYALGLVNSATPNQGQLFFYPSVDVGAFNSITCACDAMILYTRNGVNTACGLTITSHSTACNGIRIDNCTNIGVSVTDPSLYGPNLAAGTVGCVGLENEAAAVRNISIRKEDSVLTMGSYWKNGVDQYSYISASNNGNTFKPKLVLQPCCGTVLIGTQSCSSIISGVASPTYCNPSLQIMGRTNFQIGFMNCAVTRGSGYLMGVSSVNTFRISNQSGLGVCLTNGGTAWTAASDERAKDIIEYITGASEKISTLRTVIGKYKDDSLDKRRSFLIAQDVEKVLPEAVDHSSPDGLLGLSYSDTIPLIVAAIKEMKLDIDKIKQKLGI
jgi:hypothetical protein